MIRDFLSNIQLWLFTRQMKAYNKRMSTYVWAKPVDDDYLWTD